MSLIDEASALATTFNDKMTLKRQRMAQNSVITETIYTNRACALSRSAHTASPSPSAPLLPMSESRYRMSLFMPSGTITKLGDRVEVRRGGQAFIASASDSIEYGSHSVCVLDIREVISVD